MPRLGLKSFAHSIKKKIPLPAPTGKRITYKRSYRGITALDKQIIPQDRFICHTQK